MGSVRLSLCTTLPLWDKRDQHMLILMLCAVLGVIRISASDLGVMSSANVQEAVTG